MSLRAAQVAILERPAGPRLRCFLAAALLIVLVKGSSGATTDHAMTCASPPAMNLSRIQGTVYGPSGVAISKILVQAVQNGKIAVQTQTDDRGRFELKVAPGSLNVHVQYLGYKSMDLNVRVGHGGGFHAARLRIVLGLSGTRCNFATTSRKQFKDEIKRYGRQLEEKRTGP
jgi:hypothetical protein